MISDIKANVNQVTPDVYSEGTPEEVQQSKVFGIWTAGWKERLILAGKCYRVSFGTLSGGADITLAGNGTVMNLDQPSGIVAADSGYLIPIELQLGVASLADAASDEVDVLLTADRATAVSAAEIAAATGTAETPLNLLDGGPAFGGRAVSVCTVDVTDPVHSDVLYYGRLMALGTAVNTLNQTFEKVWGYPTFIAGPCSLLLYVFGTIATTFAGSLVFAHVPSTYAPTT